ncbi:uncharacterized protein MELLADRAFT_102662 [Melampsora larici-populina 98AG31]|uniref:Secreted protein n=1 Tax=Melampsora larici-populina (strain 98AG31 / pathotype 3-4-7) TaxID=747676 RepID=F4R8Z8_MELLP|nr:uncharacterized protein MELLADRAFT_102662 [Melampsora larici-populina 98AG31]EGG11242.1 hypothetical protein MELLADRAFT_102662 [Melampsora larici-populina 98AG31]
MAVQLMVMITLLPIMYQKIPSQITAPNHDHHANVKLVTDEPPAQIPIPGAEELQAYQEILDAQIPARKKSKRKMSTKDNLIAEERALDSSSSDDAPTGSTSTKGQGATRALDDLPTPLPYVSPAHAKNPARKISQRKSSKKYDLTAEERALDSSSSDDAPTGSTSTKV